ncbi:MAG: YgcG family protein [Methylotenera sp.]|nr:YgcG family protein [Methylotenera sp.]MDO9234259.1 YgcG family protein [Methylotenera sp.]MDP2070814.1 YgcG family protein [Methylotenera sp.]MDP3006340.1 YgcG family protein [Methylotenera sp.]MDP3308015.1 YgcG family protein [Methylotenera sp.]MDP3819301.1 YgcG family protein [Methylotenera sp.]
MISQLKASLLVLCAILLFASCNVRAELAAIPAIEKRVTDLTQTLTQDQQSQLEAKLATFEQQKGSQIAVLIVPTTKPEEIEQYSIRVVDAWKLGREKQDDGVLVLVAKNDRKMRIEVGYGLEGAIPDLTAKRIISEIMTPSFKQGDFYGGINNATDKLIGLVSGEQLAPPASPAFNSKSFENMLPILLFGGLILGGILRAMFGNFFGGVLNGGAIGILAWILGGGLLAAILFGIVAFFITLVGHSGMGQAGGYGGGYGGGRSSGGSDPFSGGGGGFGGGGASGDW